MRKSKPGEDLDKLRLRQIKATALKTWDGRTVYDPDRVDNDGHGASNDKRAAWAGEVLALFEEITGASVDEGEALGDLLCDLRHWCDRNRQDFNLANDRAEGHYTIETSPTGG